jgi:hypothetical protein
MMVVVADGAGSIIMLSYIAISACLVGFATVDTWVDWYFDREARLQAERATKLK